MPLFHYLHLRAFAHATEDPERVRAALRRVAGSDTLAVVETPVEGAHKNRILILEAEQKSAPAAKRLFEGLARDDPEGFGRLRRELDARFDEHLNLHLRLDKQAAYLGRLELARSDDAITVRGKVRSFAAKRGGDPQADARAQLDDFLDGLPAPSPPVSPGGEKVQESDEHRP